MGEKRPQVVAHRGASADEAEHTLGAYMRALDVGADALECDVRLTADGHLVCVHDRTIRRTTGQAGLVSTMELADLAQLDFASWKNPWNELDDEAPMRDERLDQVLTLETLLETVRDYSASTGRRVELAIETKHPTRYGGLVEKRLVEKLREFDWDGADSPVRVMSFSFTALQRVERLAPDLRLVQLIEHGRNWSLLRTAIGRDWIVAPGIKEIKKHPKLGRKIVDSGRELHVWTVNGEANLQRCLDLGATAVISDKPAQIFQWLAERGL
ncbi:glycerophosphodiester phosphodiesterase [Nocardioides sp. Kera G14]|uniref:glycerophosphodiester phosphodiesterase n=1 Tax=Nocardioides sp. Kera G14 TaxID=2884264 RepID=UPI001D125CED|nr:glycerophosphodiester phosphodiesterase family protein [Nocardioides sp. Kera G14]UDY23357.1 glycerophosphodiester phosphodiesterase [Nocardioides sp. Kera G14]